MELSPLFRLTSNKKEIPIIKEFIPKEIDIYIEPLVGDGFLLFYLTHNNNVINDPDTAIANFYKQIKKQDSVFVFELKRIQKEFLLLEDTRESRRNFYRSYTRSETVNDDITNAIKFIMIAYENKILNIENCYNEDYIKLFEKTIILNKNFPEVIKTSDTNNNFIFVEPHEFSIEEDVRLSDVFSNVKHAKIMLIVNDNEFTRKVYKKHIKKEYGLKEEKKLIITNY